MNEKKIPQCVAVILDGNRRWAKEKGLPKLEGHRKGLERLVECVRWVRDRGIPHLAVYAFSTENWNREKEEVSYLMMLFREAAERSFRELGKEGVRVRFVGERECVDANLRSAMEKTERDTTGNRRVTLWVCLSYGGRAEIAAAARSAAASGESFTEETLRKYFWSAEMPDPDIIIRPGGEKRLSNFLLWQAAYSELFFIEPYWPDFSEKLLDGVLAEYAARERRIGK